MSKPKLSVCIATYNEEKNIGACLESVRQLADEMVIVDGSSIDRTVEIAKSFGARVYVRENPPIFHINKQKAFDLAKGDWILYLDADERVSDELAKEVVNIINMDKLELDLYQENLKDRKLYLKHQRVLEQRDGQIGTEGEYVAFFFPRLNFFLGKFLRYGGVYPDGVIRLFKKDKAYLPCKSVHEQPVVLGKVGWLQNDLLHIDSPTLKRYLEKNNRYINLIVDELRANQVKKNFVQFVNFCLVKPVWWFIWTQIFLKGILDGPQGITFSFFSALRFPRAYLRYLGEQTK